VLAPDYLDVLADFICDTRIGDIPAPALEHLHIVFADTLAVIAAGMQTREMKALVGIQSPLAAPGRASVIGAGRRLNPVDAAVLNATAGVFLELDAGNSRSHGHPGIHCLPTALAIAQETGASGADTFLAYALGYEVCGRIGGAARMRIMVQPHGTYGVIGAAVAAAKLRGLSREVIREVINVAAATPLGGNRQTMLEGATVRNWYAGHSHQMGQMAVRLVDAGFTGPRHAINVTFGQVLGDDFDPARAVDGLGKRWHAAAGYIKLYAGARHLHCAVDAAREVLDRSPRALLVPENILRIEVRAHRLAAFCGKKVVHNAFGARFSVPFAIATVLYHQRWDVAVFGEAAVFNPVIRDLMTRVDIQEDAGFSAAYPSKQICVLKVVLRDGTTLEGRCEVMRGEPARPHDPSEVTHKFFDLGTPVWGRELAERICADSMGIEEITDMRLFAGGADL